MTTVAQDVFDGFAAANFTETVTYRPANGTAREITAAVVDRQGSQDAAGAQAKFFLVTVENNATRGITAAEVDTGNGEMDVAERQGGDTTRRQIVGIDSQDYHFLTVKVK